MAMAAGDQRVIYIDTSAAMKLVRSEAYSAALSRWLDDRPGTPVVSSVLIEVELLLSHMRSDPAKMARAAEVLRGIGVVTLSPAVIARAAGYVDLDLRSPDAIHNSPQPSMSCRRQTRHWRRSSRMTNVFWQRRGISG